MANNPFLSNVLPTGQIRPQAQPLPAGVRPDNPALDMNVSGQGQSAPNNPQQPPAPAPVAGQMGNRALLAQLLKSGVAAPGLQGLSSSLALADAIKGFRSRSKGGVNPQISTEV